MESKIFEAIGIDPAIIVLLLFILIIGGFIFSSNIYMKYSRLKASYNAFMRGRDSKMLEEVLREKFIEIDEIHEEVRQNQNDISVLNNKILDHYQKVGIVKYDAFHEMGGKLSFALTMLDANNSGWIINAMHSREGCYTYIKEIVKGESYIELAEEEAESLERAVFQETYGLDI